MLIRKWPTTAHSTSVESKIRAFFFSEMALNISFVLIRQFTVNAVSIHSQVVCVCVYVFWRLRLPNLCHVRSHTYQVGNDRLPKLFLSECIGNVPNTIWNCGKVPLWWRHLQISCHMTVKTVEFWLNMWSPKFMLSALTQKSRTYIDSLTNEDNNFATNKSVGSILVSSGEKRKKQLITKTNAAHLKPVSLRWPNVDSNTLGQIFKKWWDLGNRQ